MTQQQNKFMLEYQILDSTASLASLSWTVENKTYRTYKNFIAKIEVCMSNKTQNKNYFSLLQKSESYRKYA